MVNPDIGGRLDADGITGLGQDLGDLNVADDNVRHVEDAKANSNQSYKKK